MTPFPDLPDKPALLARVKPSRQKWDRDFRPPGVEPASEDEESVWDYPRPPVVVPIRALLRVMHGDLVVAESRRALAIKETAGAPVPYFPPQEVRTEWLAPNGAISICEWKGAGCALDFVLPTGDRVRDAAWIYPDPLDDLPQDYAQIAGHYAFYPAKLACFVDGERVRPQPGGQYGGWVTGRIKGPIKGAPGTGHW